MLASFIQLYKNAYSGLSRNSWYLSAVMLINRSGTMVVPFMSIYCIRQLHFSIVQAGIVMTMFGAGSISGAFVGGKLTDRIGFYDLQVGALFSGGILFLVLGYQTTFLTVCIATFILSFCNESFRPANSTAIAHYSTPENKTRSYSLNRLAINIGWAVGAGLGGLVASINYHLLFWVDGITNILAALLLLKLMPRASVVSTIKKMEEGIQKMSPYKDGIYLFFILFSTLFGMCFFQFFIMEPVFYKLNWHFSERFIGTLMALNGILIGVVEMLLVHNLEGKRHGLIYVVAGVLMGALGFILLIYLQASVFAALLVVILMTFSEMLSMPFLNSFWISRSNEYNRGEYAALYTMSWSAAQICAPVLGGVIIAYGGFSLLWWALFGLSVVAGAGYYWLYRFISRQPGV
ncbi:MFS transporter [Mucilaginibacter sp. L3T2-6]|uniref:MFS transporter n=1 Tax=Mucilaginibacter sp. L3T2-6 TaxID=3062491 RepID=UPI002675F69E|nr:MFS transporter [Mucilaginibacter sp. L3T2-6]MDO3644189.1 MFS transporter [Mucilaginibacter sp. L3T2-6]MDV6216714.1 MFS transporter [Mucilaginibacter sp. L3T2-6]